MSENGNEEVNKAPKKSDKFVWKPGDVTIRLANGKIYKPKKKGDSKG